MDVFQGRVFVYLHMEADVQLGTDVIDPQVMDGADHVRSTRHLHYLFLDLGRSRLPQDVAGVLPEHFKRGSAHKTSHNNAEHRGCYPETQPARQLPGQSQPGSHDVGGGIISRGTECGSTDLTSRPAGHDSNPRLHRHGDQKDHHHCHRVDNFLGFGSTSDSHHTNLDGHKGYRDAT